MASRTPALSAAVGVPPGRPPRALTTLSSIGFVYSASRTYSISPIFAVKPPLARQSAASLAAAAMSSGVSPCLGGAARPLKIRGELTIAACSGCASGTLMTSFRNSTLFRTEVIKVPLAHPEQAAIVSSPRIFSDLAPVTEHAELPADIEAATREAAAWRAKGGYTAFIFGQ